MRWASQRGSTSLVTVAAMCLLVLLAMLCSDLTRVLVAVSEAQTAADAAVLAAAQDVALASADPADAARDFARRNGATLASCVCTAGSPVVDVEVVRAAGPLSILWVEAVTARARAEVGSP